MEVFRRRRYGASILVLDELPVPLAGRLRGTLNIEDSGDRLRYRHGVFGGWKEVPASEIRGLEIRRGGRLGRNL